MSEAEAKRYTLLFWTWFVLVMLVVSGCGGGEEFEADQAQYDAQREELEVREGLLPGHGRWAPIETDFAQCVVARYREEIELWCVERGAQ